MVLWELGVRGPVALGFRVRGKEDDGREAGSALRGESARITRGSNPLDLGEDLTGRTGDEWVKDRAEGLAGEILGALLRTPRTLALGSSPLRW
jgi:hypothetical protein